MTARAKFLFDDDFGADKAASAASDPMLPVAEHQEAVRRADEVAYLRGLAEGRQQAESDETARLAASMQRLALGLADAGREIAALDGRAEEQAARLAIAMAQKLAGAALARQPLAEVEALVRDVLHHLRGTPHAVVRVEAGLVDQVKPRLDQIAREAGFTGAIVVLGEPDIEPGDARIEWADGGVKRSRSEIEAMLDDAVDRAFALARQEEPRR
jgi:flagellar assembly protein FliH